jgi:histone H3/H4
MIKKVIIIVMILFFFVSFASAEINNSIKDLIDEKLHFIKPIEKVSKNAINYAKHAKRKTVKKEDLKLAVKPINK